MNPYLSITSYLSLLTFYCFTKGLFKIIVLSRSGPVEITSILASTNSPNRWR